MKSGAIKTSRYTPLGRMIFLAITTVTGANKKFCYDRLTWIRQINLHMLMPLRWRRKRQLTMPHRTGLWKNNYCFIDLFWPAAWMRSMACLGAFLLSFLVLIF